MIDDYYVMHSLIDTIIASYRNGNSSYNSSFFKFKELEVTIHIRDPARLVTPDPIKQKATIITRFCSLFIKGK